jgi:hypothetical protein
MNPKWIKTEAGLERKKKIEKICSTLEESNQRHKKKNDYYSKYKGYDSRRYRPIARKPNDKWSPPPPRVWKIQDFDLDATDFDRSNIDLLDEFGIEGWEEFKLQLQEWGFGRGRADADGDIRPPPIKGMALEQEQWRDLVETYSKCALSYSEDKLMAISGMAKILSKEMDCDYVSGMWRRDLEHQLLLFVHPPVAAVKDNGTRGPSWAWTSVDGPIIIQSWQGWILDGYDLQHFFEPALIQSILLIISI